MAKQDLVNGGFIGKLGDVVGQRWKNKLTVKAYTKPANPQTVAQQANRAIFATAVRLAQQAMLINGHQGIWDTSNCGEFQLRVGQARRHLLAGETEQQAFPLYPDGFIPSVSYQISTLAYNASSQELTVYIPKQNGINLKSVEVSIHLFDPTNPSQIAVYPFTVTDDDIQQVTIPNTAGFTARFASEPIVGLSLRCLEVSGANTADITFDVSTSLQMGDEVKTTFDPQKAPILFNLFSDSDLVDWAFSDTWEFVFYEKMVMAKNLAFCADFVISVSAPETATTTCYGACRAVITSDSTTLYAPMSPVLDECDEFATTGFIWWVDSAANNQLVYSPCDWTNI